jgi:hypothetical protein
MTIMATIQRKLALLFGACLAVAAFAAPASAMATVYPVGVLDHTESNCSTVWIEKGAVKGGCELELDSGQVVFTDGKKALMSCHMNMDLNVDENGWGYTSNGYLSPGHSQCGWSPRVCFSNGKSELQEIQMLYTDEDGFIMETNMCFGDGSGNRWWGTVKILLNQEGAEGLVGTSDATLLPNTTTPGFQLGLDDTNWDFDGEDIELIQL